MEIPVLPPSDAAHTRSGSISASAPKQQSTMRKPVSPRAAVAAGSTQLAMVPGGAITLTARWKPSLFGIPGGSTDLMHVYVAALVYESVLLMAPFTWGDEPVQSATSVSPDLRSVTWSRIGRPTSMPSSS